MMKKRDKLKTCLQRKAFMKKHISLESPKMTSTESTMKSLHYTLVDNGFITWSRRNTISNTNLKKMLCRATFAPLLSLEQRQSKRLCLTRLLGFLSLETALLTIKFEKCFLLWLKLLVWVETSKFSKNHLILKL